MLRRMLKGLIVAFVLQALVIGAALAQDFASFVTQASQANQEWVDQIGLALEATDLDTLQARTATAVATGEQVESLLRAALPLAPDDASRSRVEGVLTHVVAALEAGRDALAATEFDMARSSVDAMRGEALEALLELAPFAAAQPVPTPGAVVATPMPQPVAELPRAGDTPVAPVAMAGLLTILAGIGMRRLFGRAVERTDRQINLD